MNEPLLHLIHDPADLRRLRPEQLAELADELRSFILDVVSANPGHLGASLGVVELTIALHYLFNTPDDVLVWDVGHQAYAHKILTGRRARFNSLRKWNGISGFPVRSESEYDVFGTGHASTGLSAVLGMAVASALQHNTSRQHIAVVGDGAITGGMFFEALNQAGDADVNLLIILNDNGISIDKSAGALKDYLAKQRLGQSATNPLFDAFGIPCFGPVDGNNLNVLLPALRNIKNHKGVRLLHLVTTKGKGFDRAEKEQVLFHAPGTFDRQTGQLPAAKNSENRTPLYQEVFGETLVELARLFPQIVGITPAMPTGSSLNLLMEAFPDRAFDVDIAEQHALTFAAGLAAKGIKPFCVVYSTFLQRAYDQLIHDIALQNLPVVLCVDRAGLVGEDGATHHGAFDLAFLRCVPNLTIAAPMNEPELRNLMYSAASDNSGPCVIRYPRGKAAAGEDSGQFVAIAKGKGRKLR
ncbi:MAG TPA: 1-deoxy-D-xylulose-5-phosphate synthase, partial [Bacteroidales bacterium]|nr:1-deoxy-D-xylulose-5-phosphate synthase [Bacteroidales bacterium]